MVKIENKNKYEIGDKVWWFDSWGNLRWGVIYNFVKGHAAIYENGRQGSHTGAMVEDCWPSKDECLRAEAQRSELQVAEYKESIISVEDLVKFLFEQDVNGEDYDYDARRAAAERAKELLGLDIEQ